MSDEKLQIDITAQDAASKVVDQLQGKVDKLEKSDPEVDVKADTDVAESDVDSFARKLGKLGDSDQVVVLALRAGAAQSELTQLATDIARLDASDPDIDVKLNRYAEVAGQLDDLETKIRDIADTSLDPDVGDKARSRLAGIGEEAGKTQGAVHSMAGNALGDLAATTSGIGPLGEAIGQLTETALDGEAGMKGLVTAGLGLGALSAGMFVVNKVMGEFAKTAQRAAEIKAFDTADVDAFTKALTAGKDVVQDYVDRMTALGKVTTVAATRISDFAGPVLESTKDIAPALAAAGITMTQFAKAVTGSKEDLAVFDAAVKATGISVDDQNLIISGAATEAENYATAQQNAARFTKVFGDSTENTATSVKALTSAASGATSGVDKYKTAAQQAQERTDRLNDATKRLKDGYDALRDSVSDNQAWIDLETAFDDVRTSADEAWTAASTGADDAAAKVRANQTDVNNLKQSLIDYAEQVLGLPASQVTEIETKIDQGQLDEVERQLDQATKDRKVWVDVGLTALAAAVFGAIGSGKAPPGTTIRSTAAPTSTTNVTNFLAVPDARRQAVQAQRTARVNGRR